MSRILILGGGGRLGAALARQWSARHAVRTLARPALDVADLSALERLLAAEDFDILVNGTGLTHVDRCETDREEAHTVNADAPAVMARAAADKAARLIHFSTDYVFDGKKSLPYTEEDPAVPLSWYGETKRVGEVATLAVSPRHLVVRVSWVFGPEKPSFIDTLIERARTQDRVESIADKTSSPTFADDVANWMEPFFDTTRPGGLYHACNGGGCTWQEYGQHALDCARRAGVRLKAATVSAVTSKCTTSGHFKVHHFWRWFFRLLGRGWQDDFGLDFLGRGNRHGSSQADVVPLRGGVRGTVVPCIAIWPSGPMLV